MNIVVTGTLGLVESLLGATLAVISLEATTNTVGGIGDSLFDLILGGLGGVRSDLLLGLWKMGLLAWANMKATLLESG